MTQKKQRFAYMLSRPVFFLWISIRIEGDSKFRLALPIPLFILFLLSDIAEDTAYIWRLFNGKCSIALPPDHEFKGLMTDCLKSPKPEMLLIAAKLVRNFLREIMFHWGAFDLLDVDVQSKKEHVLVRCSFR